MSTFERQNLKKSPRLAFRVSDHALERFRERVEEEFTHRGNDDLADLLNSRLRASVLVRDVTDPRVPDSVTTLYLFECRTGERLVAVVRDLCVITVLDDWMARNNYPGWDGSPTAGLGTLGSTELGTKLRAIAPVAPPPAPSAAPLPPAAVPSIADEYLALAAECRDLAAKVRSLREQSEALESQRLAVVNDLRASELDFAAKRERLLALMTDGEPR